MDKPPTRRERLAAVREAEKFVNRHISDCQMNWPTRLQLEGADQPSRSGPKVLVIGNLVIDYAFRVRGNLADLAAVLRTGGEKYRCDWRYLGSSVGGFAGHAAAAVSELGGRPELCAVVPVPLPRPFREFIHRHGVGTRHLVAVAGPAPASIHLQCDDGHLLIPRTGVLGLAPVQAPRGMASAYDAILVNPGGQPDRNAVLRAVRDELDRVGRRPTVAVCGRGDWGPPELGLVKDSSGWVFFNKVEVTDAAGRAGLDGGADARAAAAHLKAALGSATLVTTLGAEGAYLLNGDPQPVHVPGRPVPGGRAVGAGDTLLAVTALSAAAGTTEVVSLRRGVAAATRRVGGLPLPRSLADLDA